MNLRTHLAISERLVGVVVELGETSAVCRLTATAEMAADDRGLVHGGFVFGLADYAAMCAVNDPLVVLGAADVRFLAPVRVDDVVIATATVTGDGKKRVAEVSARIDGADGTNGTDIFRGTFTCFVLEHHVLDAVKESS